MMDQNNEDIKKRPIRSYILRQGRITAAQTKAIQENFQKYAVIFENKLTNFSDLFKNKNSELILEIGFGMGETSAKIAAIRPQDDFLALEVHEPGVGALLKLIGENQLSNLRLMRHDAVEVIEQMIPDQFLDGIHIYFPDPWHKKRHHKRRLIQAPFAKLLASKLKRGGYWHLATDWEDYAIQMLEVLNQESQLQNIGTENGYALKPDYRPTTKFENRGLRLGHGVWDLMYQKL